MGKLLVGIMLWLTGAAAVWAQGVPDAVLKRLKAAPEPFLDLAADLIHGFGGAQGIDRAGIARFVALERAEARAGALRRIYLADLDFDSTVSREEIAQVAAAASAAMRGRLWKLHAAADADGDGVATAVEMAGFAKAEALRAFSVADEAEVMSVLAFDSDANGWVDLAEVKAAVAALGI